MFSKLKPFRLRRVNTVNLMVRHYKPVVILQPMQKRRSRFRLRGRTLIVTLVLLICMVVVLDFTRRREIPFETVVERPVGSMESEIRCFHNGLIARNKKVVKFYDPSVIHDKIAPSYKVNKSDVWFSEDDLKYIIGAVGVNSSEGQYWDVILMIGQFHYNLITSGVTCCMVYPGHEHVFGIRMLTDVHQVMYLPDQLSYRAISCPNVLHQLHTVPSKIALAFENETCEATINSGAVVPPYFPVTRPEVSVALCTKIAYGSVDSDWLIQWMEAYRSLGVAKVVSYVDVTLNWRARNVLRYYEAIGFVEFRPYIQPGEGTPYESNLTRINSRTFGNQMSALAQCTASLSGHTYVGVVDLDEFILPSGNRSLPKLLDDLMQQYPTAAGFSFQTVYHILSWGWLWDDDDLLLAKYRQRTLLPFLDREKNIMVPSRVELTGSISTHRFNPKPGYTREVVPEQEAMLHHFRSCRRSRLVETDAPMCEETAPRTFDSDILMMADRIRSNVKNVRKAVSVC